MDKYLLLILMIVTAIVASLLTYMIITIIRNTNNKKKAKVLLDIIMQSNDKMFRDILYEVIAKVNIENYSKYKDSEKFDAIKIDINDTYFNMCYKAILGVIRKSLNEENFNSGVYTVVLDLLTPEYINKYILTIFDEDDFKNIMTELYSKCMDIVFDNIEKEDDNFYKEYWEEADNTKEPEISIEDNNLLIDKYIEEHNMENTYNDIKLIGENSSEENIDKRLFNLLKEGSEQEIIPPHEEEQESLEDDGSIEVISWIDK